jgi:hypothetical protein
MSAGSGFGGPYGSVERRHSYRAVSVVDACAHAIEVRNMRRYSEGGDLYALCPCNIKSARPILP